MKPRITVITLGVDNLEKFAALLSGWSGSAYRRNSWYKFEHSTVAFFDLQTGLKLAIWNRKDIVHETKVTLTAPSPAEFTLGHNVKLVDKIMEQAKQAGATITDPARYFFGRILRSLPRSRWALMGNSLESALEYN